MILAVIGRSASNRHRSLALGIATAAGSAGQVVGPPAADWLLRSMSWSGVFLIFAGSIIAVLVVLPLMGSNQIIQREQIRASMGDTLLQAFKDPTYSMIFLGFFSCGFQLAFITAHFPAFVAEMCSAVEAAVIASTSTSRVAGDLSPNVRHARGIPHWLVKSPPSVG